MKYYAINDMLISEAVMGCIEITAQQHNAACVAKCSGLEAYVYNGELLIHCGGLVTVYDETTGTPKEIDKNAPLPVGFVEVFVPPVKPLDEEKTDRAEYMRQQCAQSITTPFQSNALGAEHTYDCREVDQINLNTYRGAASLDNLPRQIYVNGEFKDHTLEQMNVLLIDMENHIHANRVKKDCKIDLINAALTNIDVTSVEW